MGEPPVLEVRGLSKTYRVRRSVGRTEWMRAVEDVSFTVEAARSVGIVGESGSGKTTIARCLLGLTEPTSGEIRLNGRPLTGLSVRRMRPHRRHLQMVFQMPQSSFDPTDTIRRAVRRPLRRLRPDLSRSQQEERLREVLGAVSLAEELWDRRPAALSGGQLQRAAIARALAPDPDLVALDEVTSSLDLSVRGEILSLLQELQGRQLAAFVFISHDLEVVRACADELIVMYLGQIVERGPAEEVFADPRHPYTQALVAASRFAPDGPQLGPKGERDPAAGCRLAPRCPLAEEECSAEQSLLPGGAGRLVRCWKAATPA